MKLITTYLATLSPEDRAQFACRCGTTVGYLRKAVSIGQKLGESLCIALERESGRAITCEAVRPDVDWAYLRGSELAQASAIIAHTATENVADEPVNTVSAGAFRGGVVRRHIERRAQDMPSTVDRRAHKGPPFQGIDSGVA
jgi:DNA-binding transcriptional regulator YdaS (Cro superfamily)